MLLTFLIYENKLFIFLEIIYSFLLSEAKHKAKYGAGLRILTPKQMHKRLPIALAQISAGNNSESLLNEIKSKETTKKVYSIIIKSIKV